MPLKGFQKQKYCEKYVSDDKNFQTCSFLQKEEEEEGACSLQNSFSEKLICYKHLFKRNTVSV